jgi:hypothetical protein
MGFRNGVPVTDISQSIVVVLQQRHSNESWVIPPPVSKHNNGLARRVYDMIINRAAASTMLHVYHIIARL